MDYCGYLSALRQKESNSPFFFNKFVLKEGGAVYRGKRAWRGDKLYLQNIYEVSEKVQTRLVD